MMKEIKKIKLIVKQIKNDVEVLLNEYTVIYMVHDNLGGLIKVGIELYWNNKLIYNGFIVSDELLYRLFDDTANEHIEEAPIKVYSDDFIAQTLDPSTITPILASVVLTEMQRVIQQVIKYAVPQSGKLITDEVRNVK